MKKILIVLILIFVFLFNGFTKIVLSKTEQSTSNNKLNNKYLILGSVKYEEKIKNIAKISGNQNALSTIMIDVDKYGNQLNYNEQTNISRFYKLVNSLINKIGYVDMRSHYFRNKLNRVPKSLKELIRLNKILPVNQRWILLSVAGSGYHMQGVNGEYNLKFIAYDSFCEAVYNEKGILLNENNDPINMGTYNYGAGISNINAHAKFDQYPYLLWGNTANSIQKGKNAINKGVHLGLINYKETLQMFINIARIYLECSKAEFFN